MKISFTMLLFLIFLVLKLTGHIDWSWLWVCAPLWIVGLIWVGLIVLAAWVSHDPWKPHGGW